MASQKAMVRLKLNEIQKLKEHLEIISKIEVGRLYKIKEFQIRSCGGEKSFMSWGVPEGFNNGDMRFEIIASENGHYSKEKSSWRGTRQDTMNICYELLEERLERVKKNELPLLMGLPFVSPRLEEIMRGKARVKLD